MAEAGLSRCTLASLDAAALALALARAAERGGSAGPSAALLLVSLQVPPAVTTDAGGASEGHQRRELTAGNARCRTSKSFSKFT